MDLDTLSQLVADCPYPSIMVPIDRGITGDGYYPGARGHRNGSDPTKGIMLLGRDFGLHSYYLRRSTIPDASETMFTWRQTVRCILEPLSNVGVWAINYLLGARSTGPATGNLSDVIPPDEWQPYEQYCWNFLCRAALLQRPDYIIVLGVNNRRDLNRFGRLNSSCHTFSCKGEEHIAQIRYASHPSSLRSIKTQEEARQWYQSLAQSVSNRHK
jgi:hypothetical protein